MNPKDTSNEELADYFEVDDNAPLIDDFIKELEAKEKDLDISSDLIIEVGDSDVEHDNIHDSFVSQSFSAKKSPENSYDAKTSFSPHNSQNDPTFSELQGELKELKSERNELKESLHRRQRDFDNYRNRVERERQETFKNILCNLATQVLPVIDNLNRALDLATEAGSNDGQKDFQTFLEGIVLVNQQLNEVLTGMGVETIPAVGKPFDPNYHEAVINVETDEYPHRTVVEEILRGYRIDQKVIRASMVKVSSTNKSQPPQAPKAE